MRKSLKRLSAIAMALCLTFGVGYSGRQPVSALDTIETVSKFEESYLREKYPEYFDLTGSKGLEVYVTQTTPDNFCCVLTEGTNRNKTDEELSDLFLNSTSIDEMKAILSCYNIPKEDIFIIPWQNPVWEYGYPIDADYCKKLREMFFEEEVSVKGDVNADGEFNVADVVALQKWLLAVPDVKLKNWKAADLCEDDKLDVFDLCLMKRELINSGIVESPILTIERESYIPGENGYETLHETKHLYESSIEDVDDLKAIKNFAANASNYKDCEMTEMGLDIADYGFDTLKAYYTDENGIRQELILCEFGGMCRWLDNEKVQNFVEMLIEKEYFADKDIFEWFKDNYRTNKKMPYITDKTGSVKLSKREKIWETLAYRYPDTDLSDFRLVYTPEHPLKKYLKHDVFSVYYKGILCHGYGNLNTDSNVYVINIASNFVCPIEKYSEVDVNVECISIDKLSEYVDFEFNKSDVTKILYIVDSKKTPVLAYRIVMGDDCEYIFDAVTGEKIDWIPYAVP